MSSLKHLAIRGTLWTIAEYGTSQVIRLGSNLILTRLLFPEVFGLSALITVFITGLQMFSDIGIGPSIIQNDRGDDPLFLNTAWTIQIIRGGALWLFACIAAWPFAQFYNDPQLTVLIIVSAFTAVISGFNSTGLFSANRHMRIKRLTLIEIGSQVGAISVMIVWALISPSVWAIVAGGLVSSILKMLASHVWTSEIAPKIVWDQKSFQALMHFGRWIFVSTVLGFMINNADRLILGKFLSLSDLGVFSIAATIAKLVEQVHSKVSTQILFPLYSKLKDLSREEFLVRVKKIRLCLILFFLPPLCILVIFGQDIIQFLFDSRYREAGWMLQILASGSIVLIGSTIGPFYLAFGNSYLFMKLLAIKSLLLIGAMATGGALFGVEGLIAGIALSNLLYYPIQISVYRSFSLWLPCLDALSILGSIFFISLGLWLTGQIQFF